MRADKKSPLKSDKKTTPRSHKRGAAGYSKKTALLEEAITQMNAGKYGRSSAALKELLALDPLNMEARRLFATLHLRLGSLIPARQAFDSLINEAFERQDYWLAESLLREYLAAGPRCVPFLEKLGALFQEKGDSLEAVAEYGKAIDILIEDPDTDNPQHAAQLYAKVRDLAPASPVAFRLASFFDAQTGELVARPAPAVQADGETAPSLDPSSVTTNETAGQAIPEPLADVMPWEQVEEHSTQSVPSISTELITEPTSQSVAATDELQGTDHQTDLVSAAQSLDPVDTFMVNESISCPAPEIDAEPVHQGSHDDIPTETHTPDAMTPASSMAAEDVAIEQPEFEPPPPLVTDLASPVSCQDAEPLLTQDRGAGVPESISAPMPWEDVRESTINIPDHVADDHSTPSGQTEETPAPALQDDASPPDSRDELSITVTSTSVGANQSPPVTAVDEPSVPSSSPADRPAPPLEMSKGGFSWESVFESAWKFGDKLSSSTPPVGDQQAEEVRLEEKKAEPEAASHAAPAIAPMPWDQVQETIVTIPLPEEAIAAEASEAVPAPLPVVEDGGIAIPQELIATDTPSESDISPTHAVMDDNTFSITQPPAAPSSEPGFRLLGGDGGNEVDAGHRAEESEVLPSAEPGKQADPIEAQPPVAEYQEVSSILPADVQPSRSRGQLTEAETGAASIVTDPLSDLAREKPGEPIRLQVVEPSPAIEVIPAALNHAEQATLSAEQMIHSVPIAPALSPPEPMPTVESSPQRPLNDEPLHLSNEGVAGTNAPTDLDEAASSPQPPIESAPSQGNPSHWSTGEVAVQTHRPSPKKRKRAVAPSTEPTPVDKPVEAEPSLRHEELHPLSGEAGREEPVSQPAEPQDEWIRTGESIRFIEPQVPHGMESAPPVPLPEDVRPTLSTAAAAVDVLFESSGRVSRTETRERERVPEPKSRPRLRAKLARARIAVTLFIGSCFSTTRAIVLSLVALLVLSSALVALAIGAVGLTWTIMEERPSPAFQSLTTTPQRTLSDPKKNGYLMLLGFDAPEGQDPLQVGYERKPDGKDADRAAACMGGPSGGPPGGQTNASASVAGGWFRGADPVAQFKAHQDTIRGWTGQAEAALGRYKQWLKLPFEDWGYGQSVNPPCGLIFFTHQLYLADGFVQGMDAGIDRLETDMDAWRIVLGQAKTLPVKTMALEAINNDIAVASGLLVKPDFDGKVLGRLTKVLRPLDQVELSIRWPMQSELVAASKTFTAQMKAERNEELPLHVVVASALPLPKQRRFNDYADYYEASYKAAGEGRYASMPKWSHYIHFPANSIVDYLMNPIENIVGLEPLPEWDRYNGMVVDTDAHLRLASLQAWLRRGPQDADLLARIAKGGQSVYDPYTGLPMLVNLKKGVMYSVGHDGKDQDADPQTDIVVAIPGGQSSAISLRSASSKSK